MQTTGRLVRRIVNKIRQMQYTHKRSPQLYEFFDSIIDQIEEGQVRVKVPQFEGSFFVDIRSHILKRIILERNYEPEIIELIKVYLDKNRDVIDAGANIGLFTVLFSKLICNKKKVLAIEPVISAYNMLNMNIIYNDTQDSVITFNGIASNKKGNFCINTIPGKEEYSSIGKKVAHPAVNELKFESVEVKGDTVDNLVKKYDLNPGFIKIDVEGSEFNVFEGLKDTIHNHKPIILSELDDVLLSNCDHSSQEAICFLEGEGYNVFNVRGMEKPEYPFSGDIIAIPG